MVIARARNHLRVHNHPHVRAIVCPAAQSFARGAVICSRRIHLPGARSFVQCTIICACTIIRTCAQSFARRRNHLLAAQSFALGAFICPAHVHLCNAQSFARANRLHNGRQHRFAASCPYPRERRNNLQQRRHSRRLVLPHSLAPNTTPFLPPRPHTPAASSPRSRFCVSLAYASACLPPGGPAPPPKRSSLASPRRHRLIMSFPPPPLVPLSLPGRRPCGPTTRTRVGAYNRVRQFPHTPKHVHFRLRHLAVDFR